MAAGTVEQADAMGLDPGVASLRAMMADLADLDGRPTDTGADPGPDPDAVRIEQLALLERVKAATAAAQARITDTFAASQREQQRAAGVPARRLGRGIGDQVALACALPASQGSRRLGLAAALTREMPHTQVLLTGGEISEWTATLLVRETACLTREGRGRVDALLCATRLDDHGNLIQPPVTSMTPRRVVAAAQAAAARLDVEAVVRRRAHAESERRVSVRPAPESMAWLTALVPMGQGVACYANLKKSAEAIHAGGDQRTTRQIMADLMVERLTGQTTATAVPVEIGLVLTPDALLGNSEQPGRFTHTNTPCPASTARDLATQPDAPVWLRRWFTDPATDVVTTVDRARKRFYSGPELRVIHARDQHCRHPRCDAPIAHADHVVPVAAGGPTTIADGQGLCAAHNQTKETPGWTSHVTDPRPGHHTVQITTPTGHTYHSHAPPALPP
ncbi:MAG: DUF222 domain-containing protein [Nocardioides sp.]|uniref:HNH endonuclease n=1 Tax=Nocardioides sp. TaxID=35761 RepID=UPI0039E50392